MGKRDFDSTGGIKCGGSAHAGRQRIRATRRSVAKGAHLMRAKADFSPVAIEAIASRITTIRGERVLLDADLAALYGVETRRLNEQVRRNRRRFPADFIFRLTRAELDNLMSQSATSRWGGRRKLPHAFTEHGAIQAATVLNTRRAVEVSVYVVRAFVQLRGVIVANRELAKRLDELEARIERKLDSHDRVIAGILDAIRRLMAPPEPKPKRRIGFIADD
jgi:hypothetical protein